MSNTTRRKLTLTEKARLVGEIERQYRAGIGSIRAIAQSLGIGYASYYGWVKSGIRAPGARRPSCAGHHFDEEHARLVAVVEARVAGGATVRPACRAFGIWEKSYRRWKEKFARPPVLRPGEVTALVPVALASLSAINFAPPAA
ncbi:MAG: hypothetical protein JWM80_761 [Cyanobacteria bacterium RYN_339]|nr:hypothetical protein [Cyanobacteria bacterium RYN_339]